ncbi:SPOR domain-containing protein [Acuticoccus sp.]|uniref:SPOR domain-containing protein n=1 Tax=Acuticoccus sp. TaxID=1904378 RepID=UPI003B52572B
MNGPTRSSAFDRRTALGASHGRAKEIVDELDQFVDSEPVAWLPVGRSGRRPAGMFAPERSDEPEQAVNDDGDVRVEDAGAAFSHEGSGRRAAFARRLDEELSRPAASPAARCEPVPAGDGTAVEGAGVAVEDGELTAPAEMQASERDDAPTDALDLELNDAIGAIIARRSMRADAPPAGPAEPAQRVAPGPSRPARPRSLATPVPPGMRPLAPPIGPPRPAPLAPPPAPPAPVAPLPSVAPIGGKRLKPIPTFNYQRREEPEPFPAAPPDLDDPLASVLFADARDALDAARLSARAAGFDEDGAYAAGAEADDDLPASLRRADGRAHRRPAWRSPIVGVALAVFVVAGLGLVAFNTLAGSDASGEEPRLIRADARDVKVRPADDPSGMAQPDISERTALGESDQLVIPDPVQIAAQGEPWEALPADGSAPRQVRTVVVRPDGTIVPTVARDEVATDEAPDPGFGSSGDHDVASSTRDATVRDDALRAEAPDGLNEDTSLGADAGGADDGDVGAVTSGPEPVDAGRDAAFAAYAPSNPLDDPVPAAGAGAEVGELPAPSADPIDGDASGAVIVPRPRPSPPLRTTSASSANAPDASLEARAPAGPQTPSEDGTLDVATAEEARMPWGVQLAAQRSRGDAEASARRITQKYAGVLAGAQPSIVRATVGDRGEFWRVRVGKPSRGEAAALCEALKGAGADCFVGRN